MRETFDDREIELLRSQTSDFLSALSGECQEFNDSPIWSADLSGAESSRQLIQVKLIPR